MRLRWRVAVAAMRQCGASAGIAITASAFEEGCLRRGRRIRVNFRSEIFAACRDVPSEARFPLAGWRSSSIRASSMQQVGQAESSQMKPDPHSSSGPPNQALEPTSTSVMPRAILSSSELKRRTDFPNQARVMPAVAVAHL